jgi:hypothetical protein
MDDSYLLIDYVYLDSEERKRFAQASHEYLIEQLQFTGSEALQSLNNKYRLNFNHPSKFLIWVPLLQKYQSNNTFLAYAHDNDWAAAKDRAAKLVWLASRDIVDASNASMSGQNPDVSGEFYFFPSVTDPKPPVDSRVTMSSTLRALAAKVDAQCMFEVVEGGGFYLADPENVVLLRNQLTSEDMSILISVLNNNGTDDISTRFFNYSKSYSGTSDQNYAHSVSVSDVFNYGRNIDCTVNPVKEGKLQLNGHDRFQMREGAYFNYVQPYQHFSNTPADGINVYSFALKPEDHQPSGTCNFSRIDNATLQVNLQSTNDIAGNDSNLNIYTVNYNVLRVMSGMAGTAYSN